VTALSPQKCREYERDGYLFPFAVLDAAEVAFYRSQYDRLAPLVDRHRGREHGQTHLHFPWALELATHPAVLDLVEGVIGPDILVHTSTMFWKDPHDPAFVSWHQDAHYLGLDTPSMVTAWVALSDSTVDNGCMRVIPGTHHAHLPHATVPSGRNLVTSGLQYQGEIDESTAVDFALEAGQASLHHADLLHGSRPNRSDGPRVGFVVRYVSSAVRQERAHHAVVLARGRDRAGHYELLDQLPAADFDGALTAHLAFWEDLRQRAERGEASFGPAR
jgi:ectoine hydroxylase-related dioxygenase (phytanoyl-CoA dioxygenase family)